LEQAKTCLMLPRHALCSTCLTAKRWKAISQSWCRLAGLAGQTVDQLHKHVADLHRRQLVQKRGPRRAILPHGLAHRTAKMALDDIPFKRIEDGIVHGTSYCMLRSFARRMGYLHDNEHAAALATKWFSPGGLLAQLGKLNRLCEAVLENIAPVDPAATLTYFEDTAARTGDVFFTQSNVNKRQVVRITRSIAYEASFSTAAQLYSLRMDLRWMPILTSTAMPSSSIGAVAPRARR
jgi:hypothetical protein